METISHTLNQTLSSLKTSGDDWEAKLNLLQASTLKPLLLAKHTTSKHNILLNLNSLEKSCDASTESILLSLIAVYLYKLTQQNTLSLANKFNKQADHELISPQFFPLTLNVQALDTFRTIVHNVVQQQEKHEQIPVSELDSFARLIELKEMPQCNVFEKLISVSLDDTDTQPIHPSLSFLSLRYKKETQTLYMHTSHRHYFPVPLTDIAEQLQYLADNILASPERTIDSLRYLPENQLRHILYDFNQTQSDIELDFIPKAFEQIAAQYPDHTAIIAGSEKISYASLNDQANFIAHHLMAKGVGKGDLIAIFLKQGIPYITALLGISKMGAAFIPLDFNSPEKTIKSILHDSQASFVFKERDDYRDLPSRALSLQDDVQMDTTMHNPKVSINTNDAAYVIYTSGTTGTPKGVVIKHGGLHNTIDMVIKKFTHNKDSRVLQFASPSFDAFIWEVSSTLCSGGTLMMYHRKKATDLNQFIKDHTISHIPFLTPSMMQTLTKDGLESVDVLGIGGEVCKESVKMLYAQYVGKMFVFYGLTETSILSTIQHYHAHTQYGSLGKPMQNTNIYILDKKLHPVPIGATGEICIAGDGVGAYLDQYKNKNPRFIRHPFTQDDTKRLHRSHDLGRWLANGEIEYLGRLDHQIKLHGYRIEPENIEWHLNNLPYVSEAMVKKEKTHSTIDNTSEGLIAYIKLDDDINSNRIISDLRVHLPEYMIPKHYYRVKKFILNRNDKIDRNQMHQLESTPLPDAQATQNINPEREKCLLDIWKKVLQTPDMTANDNFFRAGGDSIMAMHIAYLASEQNIYFLASDLVRRPTIRQLLNETPAHSPSWSANKPSITSSNTRKVVLDLSPLQLGLLYESKNKLIQDPYIIQTMWEHHDILKIEHFKSALCRITQKYPILRCYIDEHSEENPKQIILHDATIPLQFLDWSEVEQKDLRYSLLKRNDRYRAFNLQKAPLHRFTIIRYAKHFYHILWTSHHIVMDALSVHLLINDLYRAYRQPLSECRETSQTPQYARFIALTQKMDPNNDYWKHTLEGTQPAPNSLIAYHPKADGNSSTHCFSYHFKPPLYKKIKQLAKTIGVSLNAITLSAWSILVNRYQTSDKTTIGMTFSLRTQDTRLHNIAGPLINTLPFSIRIDPNMTIEALCHTTHQHVNEICIYGMNTYLNYLKELLSFTPENKLFNTLYVYENNPHSMPLTTKQLRVFQTMHYPLMLLLFPGERFHLDFFYDSAIYDETILQDIAESYEHILENFEATYTIGSLPHLSSKQQSRLAKWNATFHADRTSSVLSTIQKSAKQYHENPAILFQDERISYTQLEQRSNMIACYLKEHTQDDAARIVLFFDRSPQFIISVLACLKAQLTYVPIDTENPDERIRFYINDCEPSIMLTNTNFKSRLHTIAPQQTICCVEDINIFSETFEKKFSPDKPSSNTIAYIIYTSGSTGQPKGVANTYQALNHRLNWMQDYFQLDASDVMLHKTSLGFDISIWEYIWPFMGGASIVIVNNEQAQDPNMLLKCMKQHHVTTVHFVPCMLEACLPFIRKQMPENLKKILCIGETLPSSVVEKFKHLNSGIQLYNLYGPTEACIHASVWDCQEKIEYDCIPIGRPIARTQFHVLDKNLNPVPLGAIGMLYIEGDGLAHSYWKQAELTKTAFIEYKGKRLYASGDRAAWLPSGSLCFLGRLDEQHKIHGYRIELDEITQHLLRHPNIKFATTLCKKNNGHPILISYYTAEKSFDKKILHQFLHQFLPHYMVPTHFVLLDHFPYTLSGKIDTYKLQNDNIIYIHNAKPIPLKTDMEKSLGKICCRLLDLNHMDANSNLFEYRLDSIRLLQLLTTLEKQHALSLYTSDIIHNPKISELAQLLENKIKQQATAPCLSNNHAIQLSPSGKHPIFLIHPAGGSIAQYRDLAQHLSDWTIFGIQDPALKTNTPLFSSLETMATFYIKLIQREQPRGPYIVGGAFTGSTIAIEIAKQLLAAGNNVTTILSFGGWAYYPEKILNKQFSNGIIPRLHKGERFSNLPVTKAMEGLYEQHNHLLFEYMLEKIDVSMGLFKAEKTSSILQDIASPNNYWTSYIEKLEVFKIPGEYHTMFNPNNITHLSKKIDQYLKKILIQNENRVAA